MQSQTPHKEMYDPFAHYIRGVLFFEKKKNRFRFIAHRVPYMELNGKSWDSEQAFIRDYNQLIAKKYSV